jgi:hypothetical protein
VGDVTREDGGSTGDACLAHGVHEPLGSDGVRCPSCRHGYATEAELVDAYNRDVVWLLNRVREPGKPPLRTAPSALYVSICPVCGSELTPPRRLP